MILKEYVKMQDVIMHLIGNKSHDDGLILTSEYIDIDDSMTAVLSHYFLSPFKENVYYHFYHDSEISLNEIYTYASRIFEDSDQLIEQSQNIAKHLYEHSVHPRVKSGELYITYLKDIIIDGDTVDAIGIFKSENKDTFLKVYSSDNNYHIESQEGTNINKLDKGCLIFNKEREDGYVVAVIDNTNKTEAQYWLDDFLHVRQREDEYYNTQNLMAMCKNYVVKQLPNEFEVSKADQAELLNKSAQYFKENDSFNIQSFAEEVIAQPEVINSFNNYKQTYQTDRGIEIADEFDISSSAVKKQTRAFKSVIKLDKNFHIYVHGNNQYIKRGFDEATGMHYYQLFFKEEV